jgi:hypothetical protein
MAPLLPKLRGYFAEFLNHSSPERLGILYQTTCVGLGYGPHAPSLEAFLDSIGSPTSPLRAPHQISGLMHHGFAYDAPYVLSPGTTIARDGLPSCVTPSLTATPSGHRPTHAGPKASHGSTGLVSDVLALAVTHGYGNINPLSIDYACRPRLRTRLTLGGSAWPRNPWSIGARDSHSGYRYSCLHSHSHALHDTLTGPLHRTHDAPLPTRTPGPRYYPGTGYRANDTASAVYLSPATLSAQDHLTSELLRTLSRMAASKPTSWLSPQSHILSHLAHA